MKGKQEKRKGEEVWPLASAPRSAIVSKYGAGFRAMCPM